MNRGEKSDGYQAYWPLFIELLIGKLKLRFGFEFSRVGLGETPYLDRYIIYFAGYTLRLHKFWRGDDDRAPHDHPWWFITIPLATYYETVEAQWGQRYLNTVASFRPHFRSAGYRHIVRGRWPFADTWREPQKPFWSIVITGRPTSAWGFWPHWNKFIPHRLWKRYVEENKL